MSRCPKCQQVFPGESFCPHDGTRLASDELVTILEDPSLPGSIPVSSSRLQRSTDNLVTEGVARSGTLTGSPALADSSTTPVSRILQAIVDSRPERLLGIELEGRYKIERQIGEGGMGVVYLARHSVIEKLVAVKVLRPEVATSESVVKRFVQEARAASKIGHPNIVDVTDFGSTSDGLTYQVMEYLQGKTLAKLLREEGVLSVQRTMFIVSQIAHALQAAHDKGIVHRDLKPENIFLIKRNGSEDFVKIVDFGIAKIVSDSGDDDAPRLTRVGTVIGTPEYMAPEQAAGREDVNSRADIYALGIILYEMLSGKVALKGNSTVRTLAMQMLDKPINLVDLESAKEVTEELNAAVMKALVKKPSQRFQRMDEFLEALHKATNFTQVDLPLVVASDQIPSEEERFDTIPETDLDGSELAIALVGSTLGTPVPESPASSQDTSEPVSSEQQVVSLSVERAEGEVAPSYHSSMVLPVAQPRSSTTKSMLIVGLTLLVVAGGVSAYAITRSKKGDTEIDRVGKVTAATTSNSEETAPLVPLVSDAALPADSIPPDEETQELGDELIAIEVDSRPRGARLFLLADKSAQRVLLGKTRATVRGKVGSETKVLCRKSGYIDGTVTLNFADDKRQYLCRLKKSKLSPCVKGVKNPWNPDCG